MEVNVELFTYFRENRFSSQKMTLPEGIKVRDIVITLAIDPDEIGVILINGKQSNQDTILSSEDTLSLFPLISGG
jgi:sulfur carrier protein ThiS